MSINKKNVYFICCCLILVTKVAFCSSGVIVVTPSPAGVAIGGLDGTHAGTQQFTATEISASGVRSDVTSTAKWSASNGDATISVDGLATGVAQGVTTITATDLHNGLAGTSSLTVLPIGASRDGGLVYCMGTGADITNCPQLASGKIGGVIALTDAYGGEDVDWDSILPTSKVFPATNAISQGDGAANTALLTDERYAASLCATTGFYLPAIDELDVILKNAVALNASGPNAGLNVSCYWSSTEYTVTLGEGNDPPSNSAWQECADAGQIENDKDNQGTVRCAKDF